MIQSKITTVSLWRDAWRFLKKHFWSVVLVNLVLATLIFFASGIDGVLGAIVFSVLGVLFSLELYDAIKNKRDIKPFGLFDQAGKTNWDFWKMVLIINIKVFLWSLLFVIPGIVKALEYSRAIFLKYDNPALTPEEAQALSKKEMMGLKTPLFLAISLPPLILSTSFITTLAIKVAPIVRLEQYRSAASSLSKEGMHALPYWGVTADTVVNGILTLLPILIIYMLVAFALNLFVSLIEPLFNVERNKEVSQ